MLWQPHACTSCDAPTCSIVQTLHHKTCQELLACGRVWDLGGLASLSHCSVYLAPLSGLLRQPVGGKIPAACTVYAIVKPAVLPVHTSRQVPNAQQD